jgi:pimeloyl-ACP methyl ester carboxylesterase
MRLLIVALAAASFLSCRKAAAPEPPVVYSEPRATSAPSATSATSATMPQAAPTAVRPGASSITSNGELDAGLLEPAKVERIDVAKDKPASFVRAPRGAALRIIFLPGLCSNAYAYLLSFPESARAHGGVVAIDGDRPCGARSSDFHSFTWNPTLQRARIDAALAALGATPPAGGFILVGYSSGASIAQMMHERWPELYPKLVLIAPPEDPKVGRLAKARGVVSMSCKLDVPYRMKAATQRLVANGTPSIYLEMPGCTHGNVADAERLFGEAFEWLDAR